MSIFDKLFNKAANAATDAVKNAARDLGNKKAEFTFEKLPESLSELKALPEAKLDDPYKTAALTVVALCVYAADKNIGIEMLNFLKGPRPLSNMEIQFIDDRLRDGKTYVPFSYFKGAVPGNDYLREIRALVKDNLRNQDYDNSRVLEHLSRHGTILEKTTIRQTFPLTF